MKLSAPNNNYVMITATAQKGEKMETNIRIEWEGPYSMKDIGYDWHEDEYKNLSKLKKLNDESKDYGVYQVYGHHPVYGNNVLLYIGKAEQQTFAKRLRQEAWEYNQDSQNIQFYVGRIFGDKKEKINTAEWDKMIDTAERMLIYAHRPAFNSSNIATISRDKQILKSYVGVRIFNYDSCRSLMPEISGEIWVRELEDFDGVYNADKMKD